MEWVTAKALVLEAGGVRVEGVPVDDYITHSLAGPGAGEGGSFFFASGNDRRVRLTPDQAGDIVLVHEGEGAAALHIGDEIVSGRLEKAALHCPRQAYITVSAGCRYRCRFCTVPLRQGRRKTIDEIVRLVEGVMPGISAIALTGGVWSDAKDEEQYVLKVINHLKRFGIPIGASIYPVAGTPQRLRDHGVAEVKFNLETATPDLFREICPGHDREMVVDALRHSVPLFGRGHVFSNIIVGLGETDREVEACVNELAGRGVIPILRPLTPAADLADRRRPSAERLLRLCGMHGDALRRHGLDGRAALSMCAACTGCDLAPWRDL